MSTDYASINVAALVVNGLTQDRIGWAQNEMTYRVWMWSGNSVSWYATTSDWGQLNNATKTYHWVAIG